MKDFITHPDQRIAMTLSPQRPSTQKIQSGALRPRLLAVATRSIVCGLAIGSAGFIPTAGAQSAVPAPQTQATSVSFAIPAGALEAALEKFARTAKINLSYDAALIAGKTTQGLNGRLTSDIGLATLLAGTDIEAVALPAGGYSLRRAMAGQPATGDTKTLPTVQVTATSETQTTGLPAAYAGGQVARGTSLGIQGTQNVMDTPFSTISYTSELIENQQARTLADVVVNDASGRVLSASNGFQDDFQIRGFTVPSGDVGLNGLYGLTSASHLPAEIVERVNVLKGPDTFNNGIAPGGSIGGGINVITKRAEDEPLTRLTTSYLSAAQYATHLDMGRRFGDNKEWGVRVNGLWRDGEASIHQGGERMGVGALAIDYRGRRLRWSLDAYSQQEDIDAFRPQIGFADGTPRAPDARSNFYPSTDVTLKDSATATRLEYDINDVFTAYAAYGHREGSAAQLFPITFTGASENGNFDVYSSYYDSYTRTDSTDAGLRSKFSTGPIRHTLTLGGSTMNQETGYAYILGGVTSSNLYDPSPLAAITDARTAPRKSGTTYLSSMAAVDTLAIFDDRLRITLGLRDQSVDTENFDTSTGASSGRYKSSRTTPMLGLVYKPWQNVSLYTNYTSGLTPGEVVGASYANAGEVLRPYKSTQHEAGVKVDWGHVTTTAAVFQIERPSAEADSASNIYGYTGEQRNRGLELSAYGEAWHGLRLMTSAVFNDAKLTQNSSGYQGNQAAGVPDHTFNFGVDWDTPWMPGLSLNGRIINTSSEYFNSANTLILSGWTRYDVGARYRTEIASRPVTFRANVENLTNKNYWLMSGSYATVASPRTYVLSATVDF